MTKSELDLILLGQILAGTHVSSTVGPMSKHAPTPRQRTRVTFLHQGRPICKVKFLVKSPFSVTRKIMATLLSLQGRIQAVKDHYLATGLSARRHGNTKKLPANTLSFRDIENVKKFLREYAEANAILLPGRIPGYKRDDLQLLLSSTSKKVHLCTPTEAESLTARV